MTLEVVEKLATAGRRGAIDFAMESEGRSLELVVRMADEGGRNDPRETVLQMLRETADMAEGGSEELCVRCRSCAVRLAALQHQLR